MTTVTVSCLDNRLQAAAGFAGADLWVVITGGPAPHIGCCCLAVPRPSLSGDGAPAATVSTLNVTGHKDDAVAAHFAAALSTRFRCHVSVSCGIHFNRPGPGDIRQIVRDGERLLDELVASLEKLRRGDA